MILLNGELLLEISDDLLDQASVAEGHMELFKKNITIQPSLDELSNILLSQATEKGITFSIEPSPILQENMLASLFAEA